MQSAPPMVTDDAAPPGEEGDGPGSPLTIAKSIELMVAEGKLVPGQRLVEADLVARFGASRASVREALRFLAGDGVVELVRNRGGRIRRIGPKRLADMLDVFSGIFRAAVEKLMSVPVSQATRDALDAALKAVEHA